MVSTLGGTNAWGRGPAPPGKDFEHALIWCTLRAKSQYLAPNFEDLSRDECLNTLILDVTKQSGSVEDLKLGKG